MYFLKASAFTPSGSFQDSLTRYTLGDRSSFPPYPAWPCGHLPGAVQTHLQRNFFFNLNLLETKDSKMTSYRSKNSIGVRVVYKYHYL